MQDSAKIDSGKVSGPSVKSSSDLICEEIIKGLYSGRYSLGQRLVEADMARRFEVGRGSVREALKRLAAEGIVTIQPHKGASIRLLSREEALKMLVIIEKLQGLAAELAATNYSAILHDSKFKTLIEDLTRNAESEDYLSFVRSRNRFHRAVIELSDNKELSRILRNLDLHILRVQFRPPTAKPADLITGYRATWAALKAGDKNKAQEAASHHVQKMIAYIKSMPESDFRR